MALEKSMGIIRAISTSNTRKITETIKNFIQKDRRVRPDGSNPHSKGEAFSLSMIVLYVRVDAPQITPATILIMIL